MLPLLCAAAVALAQDPVQSGEFTGKVTKTVSYRYLVALPDGYEKSRERVPLVLFLHGAGERGEDVQQVRVHGPLKEIDKGRKIPAVVVAPQCPPRGWWDADALTAMVDHLERKYRIDKDRIYVTGLSMGGFGTWNLATRNPGRFAALAPVCGGGEPAEAAKIASIPIWVTHGDKDTSVQLVESQKMVDATRAAGNSRVRFDIVKGGGHDVWTDFYGNDYFYSWLFAQRRGK
ncbi:MAG: prolyl oligopeptidase family serine peptidase [Fimbriimonas sp.]